MNRLKLYALNNSGEIFTTYVTIPDLVNFLQRLRRVDIFSILAVKGPRSLFIEKITTSNDLNKALNEFNNRP